MQKFRVEQFQMNFVLRQWQVLHNNRFHILLPKGHHLQPEFQDRFDAKFRINANLSSVIGVPQLDIYPGLSLGLRNFGGHVGARYFFTDGFGVFSELGFPIAKYNQNKDVFDHLNNQTTFSVGASFNLD